MPGAAQQARYDMILESLKLKAVCGALRDEDCSISTPTFRVRPKSYLTEMRR
jgi:hypothetical protein